MDELHGDRRAYRRRGALLFFVGWGQDRLGKIDRAFDEEIDLRQMHLVVAADADVVRLDFRDCQIGAAREHLLHDLDVAEVDESVFIGRGNFDEADVEIFQSRQ